MCGQNIAYNMLCRCPATVSKSYIEMIKAYLICSVPFITIGLYITSSVCISKGNIEIFEKNVTYNLLL